MNAQKEYKEFVTGKKVFCASIVRNIGYEPQPPINLMVGHTADEYRAFLNALDFEYDSGYGTQELYGTIWFKDGTWATREEYDGSEWWEVHQYPEVPGILTGIIDSPLK